MKGLTINGKEIVAIFYDHTLDEWEEASEKDFHGNGKPKVTDPEYRRVVYLTSYEEYKKQTSALRKQMHDLDIRLLIEAEILAEREES